MKMLVINYGSMNTAALQRINGITYSSYDAAAVRHVVSDHEHLDDDAKLAEWYDKVVDNEICYHLDDALSDTWFTVVDAFTYTALCYVLELVHEAICDGKEM